MKECELIKGGNTFGLLSVKSTIPLSLSFKRSKDCNNLCSSSERALGPYNKSKTRLRKLFTGALLKTLQGSGNRPVPSSKHFHFQSEAKQNLSYENEFYLPGNRKSFLQLINSFELSLALKQRLGTTRNWP